MKYDHFTKTEEIINVTLSQSEIEAILKQHVWGAIQTKFPDLAIRKIKMETDIEEMVDVTITLSFSTTIKNDTGDL